MEKTWKSHDAGILDIIAGMIITAIGVVFPFAIWNLGFLATTRTGYAVLIAIATGVALLSLGLFIVYGGEMAIKRKRWGVALAASLCASIVVLGIPSLVLTIISKKEFSSKPSQKEGKQSEQK